MLSELKKYEEDCTIYYDDSIRICDLKFDGRKRFKLIFLNNPQIIYDVSGKELKKNYSNLHPIKKVQFPMEIIIYF